MKGLSIAITSTVLAFWAPALTVAERRPFFGISNTPGNGGFDLAPISANTGDFRTPGKTRASCPDNVKDCPQGLYTGFEFDYDTGELYLNAEVPGGQQVFVTGSGVLSYTKPHGGIPSKGHAAKFDLKRHKGEGHGRLVPKGKDLDVLACPYADRGDTFLVIGKHKKGDICFPIHFITIDTNRGYAAWQYD